MAKFSPWKHYVSTNLTHDVGHQSVAANENALATRATGNRQTGGSHSLSKAINLGFVLGALSLAIVEGISLGGSSRKATNFPWKERGLQNMALRIIGGGETQSTRHQYAVSLQNITTGRHGCGGSLIAPDIVLTSVYCQGLAPVVIGRHNLSSSEGELIPIKLEIPHTAFNNVTYDNDLMLVLLERPTTMDLPFVKLNTDIHRPTVGEGVTVMGWGDRTINEIHNIGSAVLMSADILVISNEDCDNSSGIIVRQEESANGTIVTHSDHVSYNGWITDNMLCAANIAKGACWDDYGSPLVIEGSNGDGTDDVLVGVFSHVEVCGSPNFPGVYARISQSYAWIKDVICSQSSNPPADFSCEGITNMPSPTPTEGGETVEPVISTAPSPMPNEDVEVGERIGDQFDSPDDDAGTTTLMSSAVKITDVTALMCFISMMILSV